MHVRAFGTGSQLAGDETGNHCVRTVTGARPETRTTYVISDIQVVSPLEYLKGKTIP